MPLNPFKCTLVKEEKWNNPPNNSPSEDTWNYAGLTQGVWLPALLQTFWLYLFYKGKSTGQFPDSWEYSTFQMVFLKIAIHFHEISQWKPWSAWFIKHIYVDLYIKHSLPIFCKVFSSAQPGFMNILWQ